MISLETLKAAEAMVDFLKKHTPESYMHHNITVTQLFELKRLDLFSCSFETLPPEIGCLTHLEELILAGNRLTSIPPEIGQLTNLTNLSFALNLNLTTLPPELGKLTKLRRLNLNSCKLKQLPSWLNQLTALQTLLTYNCDLETLDGVDWHKLPDLTNMDVSANKLKSVPIELADLSKLNTLRLDSNQLTELPVALVARQGQGLSVTANYNPVNTYSLLMRNEHIMWGFAKFHAPKRYPSFAAFIKMELLDLRHCGIASLPFEIGCLTQLKTLLLDDNKLTALPQEIGHLTKLLRLSVANNQLTVLPASISRLVNLAVLSLHNNKLTTLPNEMASLTKLSEMRISHNQFEQLPACIQSLTALKILVADDNRLSAIDGFDKLAELIVINLAGNKLTTVPDSLAQLSKLEILRLVDNTLVELPRELLRRYYSSSLSIYVSDNKLLEMPKVVSHDTSIAASSMTTAVTTTVSSGEPKPNLTTAASSTGPNVTVTMPSVEPGATIASTTTVPSAQAEIKAVPAFMWTCPRWYWTIKNGWLQWRDSSNESHALRLTTISELYVNKKCITSAGITTALEVVPLNNKAITSSHRFFYSDQHTHMVDVLYQAIVQSTNDAYSFSEDAKFDLIQ